MQDILFIDTSLDNIVKSLSNVLVVPRFMHSKHEDEDKALSLLTDYILEFNKIDDVRTKIQADFGYYDLLNMTINAKAMRRGKQHEGSRNQSQMKQEGTK